MVLWNLIVRCTPLSVLLSLGSSPLLKGCPPLATLRPMCSEVPFEGLALPTNQKANCSNLGLLFCLLLNYCEAEKKFSNSSGRMSVQEHSGSTAFDKMKKKNETPILKKRHPSSESSVATSTNNILAVFQLSEVLLVFTLAKAVVTDGLPERNTSWNGSCQLYFSIFILCLILMSYVLFSVCFFFFFLFHFSVERDLGGKGGGPPASLPFPVDPSLHKSGFQE
jgi:hypothetical protein